MKILIATDTYFPSVNGAAYFTYRLANILAKRGHKVFVLCPSKVFRNTVSLEGEVTVYGIRSIHIPVYQKFRISPLFISQSSITEIIRNEFPDVVHVQNHFMIGKGAVIAAKQLGIPVMGTNHFMPENLVHYFHLPKFAENWLKDFGWRQCIEVFEKLDIVTSPTRTAANLLKSAGFNKEIIPISCGLDLERFKPENDGLYLKKRYKIPTNEPILLYVGRLDKEKKIEVIINALPDILKKINVHLVLAGIGEYRPQLENLIEKLGVQNKVTFTGFIPDQDLQNIYLVGDLFVIAGIAELQSIVTMEAMASGLPVAAVDAMALPELVHDSENGYLFPAGDSKSVSKQVIAILSDQKLHDKMSNRSLEIIQDHSINRIIDKYEELYHKISKY